MSKGQSTPTRTKRLSTPNFGNYTVLDMAVHPEVILTVSHRNGLIEPRYAETGIRSGRPKPILKKSITFQNDSPYFAQLQNIQTRALSKSANNSQEENLNSSCDSELGRADYFRAELERKFSKLNATENFDATQTDNMEYLKYNALSYQQNNNSATSSSSDVSTTETRSVHQRFLQREESEQLIAAMGNGSAAYFQRKPSRSVGDASRVEQVKKSDYFSENEKLSFFFFSF